ncbi:hydrogenase expression/formation protein HypC [Halalkaliarchaeum desulfuricum]|uniref:Hydrogenase expression/formation protein HypC n=1 Tax=Halalkaliarchaeum desulfuricum TaxID=2055893 RepID=A0A343TGM6_9EURY|nr:HypC/HybG/HupF family hydrogenase formation chaperone [Halalkaliarchaeum desulfuricum]AUX08248.1 hydrogenase expression/formation protein HypC [Halalkaliarchaeum desulfuricum]
MCLGIPGEILEIDGLTARAEFWNVEKEVRLDIVGDEIEVGDYVLNHAGFAIRKIPDDDVEETIELYESLLAGDEDEALEEIGATDATLEFGDRPTAVDSPEGTKTTTIDGIAQRPEAGSRTVREEPTEKPERDADE